VRGQGVVTVGRRRRREGFKIRDLKRHAQLAVAWSRHRYPVPRWTWTRYGLHETPNFLAPQSRIVPPPPLLPASGHADTAVARTAPDRSQPRRLQRPTRPRIHKGNMNMRSLLVRKRSGRPERDKLIPCIARDRARHRRVRSLSSRESAGSFCFIFACRCASFGADHSGCVISPRTRPARERELKMILRHDECSLTSRACLLRFLITLR